MHKAIACYMLQHIPVASVAYNDQYLSVLLIAVYFGFRTFLVGERILQGED